MKDIWILFRQLQALLETEKDFKTWQELYKLTGEFSNNLFDRYEIEQRELISDIPFLNDADRTRPWSFGQCGDDVYWKIIDNILYIGGLGPMWNFGQSCEEMISVPWQTVPQSIIILSGVTSIGEYAFSGGRISNIAIPDSVKTVGQLAFFDARIDRLQLPETIDTIEDGILTGFSRVVDTLIISVNIPNIKPMAFFNRDGAVAKTIMLQGELPDDLAPLIESCLFDTPKLYSIHYPKAWDTAEETFYDRLSRELPDACEDFLQALKNALLPQEII